MNESAGCAQLLEGATHRAPQYARPQRALGGRMQGGVGCPALPFGFCPRLWDERHIPGMEEDDAAIYSEALARRRHWPLWLIIVRPSFS